MRHLLLLVLSSLIYSAQALNVIRRTRYGLIRGLLKRSPADSSIEYFAFQGVPYASPPVGNLRFQEPLPPQKWDTIRDASVSGTRCTQISDNFDGDDVVGSEDCLYLDVFEPKTTREPSNNPLPVMIWIHGGTFIFGSSHNTGPEYLMEKPVVIVTLHYRLNVFGFLSTKDEYAKGNLGLKDQAFALKWVQENIANFGGDPNQVTIFGESAGGASVLYHILSRKSRGLFQQAISQSGSSLNRWAHQEHPKEMTLKLAKGLGIETTDSKLIIQQLQATDYKILLKAAFNASIVGFYTPYYAQPFAPSIETESDTAFLTESMFSLLEKGDYAKVPYLTGFNTEEGSFGYTYIDNGRTDINIYKEHPELLIPLSMHVPKESDCYEIALERILEFHFNNGDVTDKINWINYMSQELFVRGIIKTMKFMYNTAPLYFYRISYVGSRPISFIGGVGHYEEVQYLWYPKGEDANPVETESDKLTRKRLVTMWTNFATTGNPTPKEDELLQNVIWPPVTPNNEYLDFGNNLTVLQNPNQQESDFWEKLFDECGYPPYVTY